jgi:hypothetical protein
MAVFLSTWLLFRIQRHADVLVPKTASMRRGHVRSLSRSGAITSFDSNPS